MLPLPQHLSDRAHKHQRQREAQPHAQAVQCRVHHTVLGGKHLCPPQNDAVHHDERQIDPQRGIELRQKAFTAIISTVTKAAMMVI